MRMTLNSLSSNMIDLERVAAGNQNLNVEKNSNVITGGCHWTRTCRLYLKAVAK